MTNVVARTKIKGKHYEILVDVDKALKLKKGESVDISEVISSEGIFHDSKKGLRVSDGDLKEAFGTTDTREVAEKIVKSGEIQIPLEQRNQERENKKKQIIDFLARHAIDPRTSHPYTADTISRALDESGINIENKPMEQQISKVIEKLKNTIPIKIQTKKLKLTIPSEHSGRVYGLLQDYKESENWLSNGDLEVIVNIPVGLQEEFYDKLNGVTHGSVISQEIKEQEK